VLRRSSRPDLPGERKGRKLQAQSGPSTSHEANEAFTAASSPLGKASRWRA
jgi:hypothetical protein